MDITEDNMILTWTWALGESEEKRRNKLKLHSGKLKEMEIYTNNSPGYLLYYPHDNDNVVLVN